MPKYSKGLETRDKILKVSRELFYANGFNNTTVRQISEKAGTNLGLLKYYFNGKEEIGSIIYSSIRTAFDDLIKENEPDLDEVDLFYASSALELYLCLENVNYGRFYHELSHISLSHNSIYFHITKIMKNYTNHANDDNYIALAATSITSIKPALVEHAVSEERQIDTDTYLDYYIKQQMHYLGITNHDASFFIQMLKRYYINVAANFTPIFTRLLV